MMFSQWLNSHRIVKRLANALIRLRVCAGWSEPLLVAHTTLLEISCRGTFILKYCNHFYCCIQTCCFVGIVSVTSTLHYQRTCRPVKYIRGLIPQKLVKADPFGQLTVISFVYSLSALLLQGFLVLTPTSR